MKVKGITLEDFINYKKPSMVIAMPHCTFKCEKDCPKCHCQNSDLAKTKTLDIDNDRIIELYLENPFSEAVVFAGLEPFDDFEEMLNFISRFRQVKKDDVIIYTGYYKKEILERIEQLKEYDNIIIKYGRFIPEQEKHLDPVLGIYLASDNQYAEKIS